MSRWTDYQHERLARDPEFKARRAENHAKHRKKLREEVIAKYGGFCVCCGEGIMQFLCIDHVNGGGNIERAKTAAACLYYKLKREPVSKEYQVLCHNCNFAKWAYGRCPHKEEEE